MKLTMLRIERNLKQEKLVTNIGKAEAYYLHMKIRNYFTLKIILKLKN